MPINAVCPECENRFQLQESLLGQSMRCPFCKTVFVVTANASKLTFKPVPEAKPPEGGNNTRPRADLPETNYRSGSISDFVQVVEGSSAKPLVGKIEKSAPTERKWTPDPDQVTRETFPLATDGPTEMKWSPDMELPGAKREPSREIDLPAPPTTNYTRQAIPKPVKKHRGRILAGLIVFTLCCVAVGGFFLKQYLDFAPERLYAAGKKEYDDTHYDQSRRLFDQLAKEYPDHPKATEARFFGPLAGLRNAVGSVMNKTDPAPAIGQWDQFQGLIADPALAPFAEKNRFGIDIWQTGTKLVEDTLSKGNDVFNRDDPADSDKWLQEATRIEAMLERFRPDDAPKPESVTRELVALRQKIDGSRVRADALKDIHGLLTEPDDESLQRARQAATARGIEKDDGYLKIIGEAEQKIRAKAVYIPVNPPVRPVAVADDGMASLLFAPRLDRGPRVPVKGTPTTFFALARGILYALDESDGHVLWAMRTGIDSHIPATRVPGSEATPELAVVPSMEGGQAGLHARHFRNGLSMWYQPLPAPCGGQPVIVGPDLYVPLADGQGTILEIVAATGELKGKIQLGRMIGGPLVLRPGTSQLFIPAESASVYVFDVDRRGPNSEHLDPARIGVVSTKHAPGTLQGIPFFANPEPDNPGPRHLLACMTTGLDQMALRACPFVDVENGGVDSSGPPTEIAVPGWSRFPVYCDGEKIALVTDQRQLMLLGLGLTGNKDLTLFPLPGNNSEIGKPRSESAAQLVMADEVNYWVLFDNQLRQFRSGFTGRDGVRLMPVGKGLFVGEPVQSPQLNARRDMMVVFTHEGSSHLATAVDSVTGQLLWQRELGLLAKGEAFRRGDDLVWLDQGGGMTKLDVKSLIEDRKPVWLVDVNDRWLIAAPATGFRSLTGFLDGPDGTAITLMESDSPPTRRFLLRVFDGAKVSEQLVPAPGRLAGQPVVVGRSLVLPMDNGSLYRITIGEGRTLEMGPTWRGNQLPNSTTCFLTPMTDEDFLATDGNKAIIRWRWATANKRFESRGRLSLRDKIRVKPFSLPGSPNRAITIDNAGNLVLWDADQFSPTLTPSRVWHVTGKEILLPVNERIHSIIPLPAGSPASFVVIGNRCAYALKIDQETPVWKSPAFAKPVVGQVRENPNQFLLTDQSGDVRRLNLTTGDLSEPIFKLPGPHAVAGGAVPLDERHLLIPLGDGTLLIGEAGPKAAPLAPGKP
ncbi:PQQ-binding-like beta-propeller repeat protein [Zavarzinella formosa]|uniref:hypothetical protein n=1 Tax=Zavarzinella formosa TaxID=360055 RepID=UPI0012F75E0A|nr:hypothetical protein [Zavarzinella formosa]